ncbi:MAG: PVC-type heme-binding CxxCH protein [Verrucomicrobiota bacterium]
MINRCFLTLFLSVLGMISTFAQAPVEGRRLEVLFLGDDRGHKPIERYRVLKQGLGPQGINLTFVEDLKQITRENLDLYDALIVYANHESDPVPTTIRPWVNDGGALVALHSACGNFHPSKEWFDLIGGRFKSHEGHEISPKNVDQNHAITKNLPVLKCWDETYQHMDLTADRHVLQVRDPINQGETAPEPWTWTRDEGKGRVFYTASGHDLRCWKDPAYQELVKRGILWAIGDRKAQGFAKLKLPPLVVEVPRVTNRAHPEIPMMALQKPLTAAESALHTQVPAGTRLVLFASEPMVMNPIAIDWDERGRAWVVESFGYPNNVPDKPGSGEDKIKILEDTNGDGKADKMTVFASGLRHCTTTVFVKGGVVATDGRDIVYLRDDDGDGKSDTRKVLATGLDIHDTHASTSHFLYGMDNWIYATVGYSGVDIEINGKKHKFGQSVFRFRPDLSELEHLQSTTNNTWGLAFTEDGDVIGSTANNNPSWIVSIPSAAYAGSGIEQPLTPRLDTSTIIYPNTMDITQVDQIDRYTAAAGHQFYTDNVFAGTFSAKNAFICEPTGHLVADGVVEKKGSLMTTFLRGNNIFASSDAWAAPVAARVGPDGAVWIADWYNPIIQHNVVFRFWNPARNYDQPHSPYQTGAPGPGKGNAYETPLRDKEHGRIWRIVPKSGVVRKGGKLDPAKPASLAAGLASPSQLMRLHAQRLLVERGGQDAAKPLEMLINQNVAPEGSDKPLAALHAIWALQGIGAPSGSEAHRVLTGALGNADPLVRRHAMLALGASDASVVAALPELISKVADPRELLYVLTTVAQGTPNQPVAAALWKRVSAGAEMDDTLREAARLAMRRQAVSLLSADFSAFGDADTGKWYGKEVIDVIGRVAASPNRPALVALAGSAPAGLRSHIEKALAAAPDTTPVPVALPEHLVAGRDGYMKSCIECHQANGQGVPDTFPPLAGSEWVSGNPRTFLRIMLGGLAGPVEIKGVKFNSVMPGHSHMPDEQIAAIASYVRYAFGDKKEKPFPAEQVKALRPDVEKRNFTPWTVEDLKKLEKN